MRPMKCLAPAHAAGALIDGKSGASDPLRRCSTHVQGRHPIWLRGRLAACHGHLEEPPSHSCLSEVQLRLRTLVWHFEVRSRRDRS